MEETTIKFGKNLVSTKEFLAEGHNFCSGCGEALAVRLALKAVGENVIIANATGCCEVCTTPFPVTSWRLAWLHTLFENAGAEISGIESALKIMTDRSTPSQIAKLQKHFHQGFGIQPAVFEKCAPSKS